MNTQGDKVKGATLQDKESVREFWERASCGEDLYLSGLGRKDYYEQERARYELEPYIESFADFPGSRGRKVLEIGVGLGADHRRFAQAGAELSGIDLTKRAIEHTRRHFELFNLKSTLATGDAENLQFPDSTFDIVYSWGVIHHSPDTPKAVSEIHRVLRKGGIARIMIYHKWSLIGYMLWTRYALLRMRPWMTLSQVYPQYLESPGTKAYSVREAQQLFSAFSDVQIRTVLTHGDLLESAVGQRHRGPYLELARKLWPRALLRKIARGHGLFMLITAVK